MIKDKELGGSRMDSGSKASKVYREIDSKDAREGVKTSFLCAVCKSPMVVRRGVKSSSLFLGCSKYPKCSYSEGVKIVNKLASASVNVLNTGNVLANVKAVSGIEIELKKISEKLDKILLLVEKLASVDLNYD